MSDVEESARKAGGILGHADTTLFPLFISLELSWGGRNELLEENSRQKNNAQELVLGKWTR
jgi:hypothetical protein